MLSLLEQDLRSFSLVLEYRSKQHDTSKGEPENIAANGAAAKDFTSLFAMQLYCVIGSFPDIDSQLAGYREFINYFDGGCVNDSFEGFEFLHRVYLLGQGLWLLY